MGNEDFSGIRNKGPLPDPQQIKVTSDLDDLMDEYVDSAASMLQELEVAALAYEAGKNREENAAAVRRILHKLKGEAGIVGIDEIYEFCHQAEFAVDELSDDERSDMLLRVKDWLDAALQHLTGETTSASREHTSESATDGESRCSIPDTRYSQIKNQETRIEDRESRLKILIAEDDFTCRKLLQTFLSEYGECFVAINGHESVEAVREALDEGQPYDLICLDIMMPEMDGHKALEAIRQIENEHGIAGLDGVKVIMTTVLGDSKNVIGAFRTGCEAYIVKPVSKEKLLEEMEKLGLFNLSTRLSLPKSENSSVK
jgi:CheY-like chemotaxis protein/HPt (histidine-containing phosphotransfer) domain-containing protein